ncbi:single-stranded-DNA-specific exonuclease RecJ [Candidatus Parcubacteria bacterium]|nr:single-stranded-DNA-specific exonuclease RecJ [Candidatus Parcubacteria bacterium]
MFETIDQSFIKKILKDRGFNKGETEDFLNPIYIEENGGMYDGRKMKDMDKAIERVWAAIDNNEKIGIYSDYDADGVPGAVVLHSFFKKIKFDKHVIIKIPHRHKDGFGLHDHLINELKEEEVKLIITIDLGSSNVLQVDHANSLGMDVIITDHHEPHEKLPKAVAILNPKQEGCKYPDKNLCGSGVIFKLVHLMITEARKRKYDIPAGYEKWLLDMVGLATISDMVPLIGENRVFAYYGLKVLQKNKRKGIYHLLSKLKINERYLDESDIGFSVSPCINAASRMSHAIDAFNLLSSTDEDECIRSADALIKLNKLRKSSADSLIGDIKNKIDVSQVRDIIVIGDENWSPTILGPAASNMVRQFQLPVFIYASAGEDVFRGSCRSIPGISVVDIMSHVSEDFFIESGGHHASGGFAFAAEKRDLFEPEMREAFRKYKEARDVLKVDEEITADEISYKITHNSVDNFLIKHLAQMKPFGMKNPNPLFCIKQVSFRTIKYFGKQKEHIEFVVEQFLNDKGTVETVTPELFQDTYKYSSNYNKKDVVKYISFFADNLLQEIQPNVEYDIYGRVEESNFLGKKEIRVKVEYIHVSEK